MVYCQRSAVNSWDTDTNGWESESYADATAEGLDFGSGRVLVTRVAAAFGGARLKRRRNREGGLGPDRAGLGSAFGRADWLAGRGGHGRRIDARQGQERRHADGQ